MLYDGPCRRKPVRPLTVPASCLRLNELPHSSDGANRIEQACSHPSSASARACRHVQSCHHSHSKGIRMELKYTTTEDHFTTEAQAFAEIAARGWHALARDVVGTNEELHWHDFDTVVYVVTGTAFAALADGSVVRANAGSRVEAPARLVHRDLADSNYRAIFGFSIHPAAFTKPLNKPPSSLHSLPPTPA